MQQSQSYVEPKSIDIVKINDTAKIRLIKDVQQQDTDDGTLYTYIEVVFTLVWRDSLQESITNDFEVYWTFGVDFMAREAAEQTRHREVERLVSEKQLSVELDGIKEESNSTLIGLADAYEQLLKAEQENTSAQIALADVYELVLELKNEIAALKSNA